MKRTIRRIAALMLLILLLPAILLAAACSVPPVYGETYYAELAPMVQRMDLAEGRRLILVGGSSVAFGTDTALLEEILRGKGYDFTVCPMGLYAAVGTSAMLSLSGGALREGDLVVLAMEPTSETLSTYFGATAFWKCAEQAPSLLLRLNGSQRAAAAGNAIPFLQERAGLAADGESPRAEGVYSRAAFDENCNLTWPRPGNTLPLGFDPASPIDLARVAIEPAFAQEINEYCANARRRGAQVVLSFAPMNRSAMTDASGETLAAYFALCNSTFDCPAITDPERCVMDSAWFYDSNFHLNTAGSTVNTVRLAEDVLAWLGCWSPVEILLPAMPESAAAAAAPGGDGEAFTYTPVADGAGWMVSGVTAAGAEASVLTVPSAHEGRPVVGLTGDALREAAALEELRLPQTVATIPEGLLAGCPTLRRLVLEHTDAPCGLAAHALEGADRVRIYVPAAAWPMYRDGYGCEANPWAPWLDRIYTY